MAVINFRTDKKVKKQAMALAGQAGLSLSDVLNTALRRFVRTKKVDIDLNEPADKESIIKGAKKIFKQEPAVKLGYLFGSQAEGTAGPMSDYDFAVYVDEKDRIRQFDIKLDLMAKLVKLIGSDKVDVVVLNSVDMPDLKYDVIAHGRIIYEEEPFKVLVEPRILNEYFDFNMQLIKNGIIKP